MHRLQTGRKLVLGGVEIPYTKGLLGHSDADVVYHAVCDAILGAAGLGDIGEHFPNTDAQYKGAASSGFLKASLNMAGQGGWSVDNVDVMILAQEPKLKAYKTKMKEQMAKDMGLDAGQVNIKAGTNEDLGYIGAGEAIAAYAVVLLRRA